jgi:hypothetical protein
MAQMAGVSTHPLAETLNRHREDYNQRFLLARQQNRRLSAEQFAQVLRQQAAPLAEAVAASAPQQLDAVVSALYDNCLRLTGLDLLGGDLRLQEMERVHEQLLPALAEPVARAPQQTINAFSNAVYNLAMQPGADAHRWITIMTELGGLAGGPDSLLQAGGVAAWRCGMAHYRADALQQAATLDEGMLQKIFDLQTAPARDALLRQLQDPWHLPGAEEAPRELRMVGRTGGFIGFDGPFADPPEVTRFGEQLFAFDRQQSWQIFADAFGVVLIRYGNDLPEGDPEEWTHFGLDRKGKLSRDGHSARYPELANWSSAASTEYTLAVTLPHSHHIFLLALA